MKLWRLFYKRNVQVAWMPRVTEELDTGLKQALNGGYSHRIKQGWDVQELYCQRSDIDRGFFVIQCVYCSEVLGLQRLS